MVFTNSSRRFAKIVFFRRSDVQFFLRKRMLPYLLIFPTALFIIIFLIVPLLYAFYCSLYRCDYMNFTKFLGFKNYFDVLSNKEIVKTMYLTFFVSFVSLFFALLLGTLLALWINISKGIFAYSLQILSLIPWVTSMIVSALLWRWMLQGDFGLINYILSRLGAKGIGFLTDVKIVVYTLIFVMTWRVLAYVMVQILAGLKAIPREYEEAANIDGANSWQLFWKVKFPLLKTPVAISCIIVALSNINNVTVPLSLTGGGPGTTTTVLAVEVYKQSFSYYHFGESSALSILLLLVNLVLIFLYIKVVRYDINKI